MHSSSIRTVCMLLYGGGENPPCPQTETPRQRPPDRDPLDRGPRGRDSLEQTPSWTETPEQRPRQTETPTGRDTHHSPRGQNHRQV